MKYIIRHIPHGWKTTAIVVQRANSPTTSPPLARIGLITRQHGYSYVEVDMYALSDWLCRGARYASSKKTNRAIEMCILKWLGESARMEKKR
jgi:hypothetical protein